MKFIHIIDEDENFVKVLGNRVAMEFETFAEISVITDLQYLNQYLSEYRKLGILIIDEKLYSKHIAKQGLDCVIVLTEQKANNEIQTVTTSNELFLYKYQSLNVLLQLIKNFIVKDYGKEIRISKDTKLYCIYSPIGGAGKTTIAMQLCNMLAKQNRKVLYINLETMQEFSEWVSAPNHLDEEKIKRITDGTEQSIKTEWQNYIGKYKDFFYLLPFKNALLFDMVSYEKWIHFLNIVKKIQEYECIILDIPKELNQKTAKIFSIADQILVLLEQDKKSYYKINRFLLNLDCTNEKFFFACNKYKEGQKDYLNQISLFRHVKKIEAYIPYYEEIEENEWIEKEGLNQMFMKFI